MDTTQQTPPKRINPRWLDQQKAKLASASKEHNPEGYAQLEAEIQAAEQQQQQRDAFEGWVESKTGTKRLNDYPYRAGGQTFEPGQVFLKYENGKVVKYYTLQGMWAKYQEYQAKHGGQE